MTKILDDYAQRLIEQHGALHLSGVSERLAAQLKRSGKLMPSRNVHIVGSTRIIGAATMSALAQAERWVVDHKANVQD